MENNIIYTFWTDSNPLTYNRFQCLNQLAQISECAVVLITQDTLSNYILESAPLHPAYEYLSATHRADYLRTYFMNFYGGGYSDIKKTTGSWKSSFDTISREEDKYIIGYQEIDGGQAFGDADSYKVLVGNCAYICKPHTPLTEEWYNTMIELLDEKLPILRLHPAQSPLDCAEISGGKYPIEWNEMLGRIFHRLCYTKYKDNLIRTLPISVFNNYR
jgi:hypothetical protein